MAGILADSPAASDEFFRVRDHRGFGLAYASGWCGEPSVRKLGSKSRNLHPLVTRPFHPPRNTHNQEIEDEQRYQRWVQDRLNDSAWLEQTREKLASPSQFMKDFKQFAAQTFNKLDQTVGHFWESRFRSIPLDNREAVLATMAYVDLNPFAAKLCEVPEQGEFTSLKERVGSRQQELIEPEKTSNESSTTEAMPQTDACCVQVLVAKRR